MHVLLLNQTFHPDVTATAQHLWDLARHLKASGHSVTVVTARNYYGTTRQHAKSRETIEGIDIHRVRGTALGKQSVVRRLSDFGSFYVAAAARIARLPAPDVVVALTSPPMIAVLGAAAKRLGRAASKRPVRFVYYVMDVYPDAQIASGMLHQGSMVERVLHRITASTLRAADGIIVLGRDMKRLIQQRYGSAAPDDRIHIVRPWADMNELRYIGKAHNELANAVGLDRSFTIVHSGNFGIAHDVETIVDAIKRTEQDANLVWLFIGGGQRIRELEEHAERENWTHVRFLPYQERESLNASLNLGDAHLVTQLPEFTGVVVPSKLFGILAVGRPVLMVGPADSECARIVAESGAGYVIPNGGSSELVAAVRQLRDDSVVRERMGLAARHALETQFDRNIACRAVEDLLTTVVNAQRAAAPPEREAAGAT